MRDFDRYGAVELDTDFTVKKFKEKQFYQAGDINGGVYVLNVESFLDLGFPEKFSFEKNYLEKYFPSKKIFGAIQDEYFIDIGIPEDYQRAQEELKQIPLYLENIGPNWTLFLDRDGVINYEKENNYILNWDEFEFYPGVTEAISRLSKKFGAVIVISNQRGVGRGLMTEEDLLDIQARMKLWRGQPDNWVWKPTARDIARGWIGVGALFLSEVVLGLLSRAAPQLNILALGFPVKILLTLSLVTLALRV